MTTDVNALFIDTNVLIYGTIIESPQHQKARDALNTAIQHDRSLWISRQVLREYIATMTRPQNFQIPLDKKTVVQRIEFFQTQFNIADDSQQTTDYLLELIQQIEIGGKQIHDANIVATMMANDVTCLLTHNTVDFRRFEHLIRIETI